MIVGASWQVEAVRSYMEAEPDAPEVVALRASLAELRSSLTALLAEIAAIEDPVVRAAEAIRVFGKRGPRLLDEGLG